MKEHKIKSWLYLSKVLLRDYHWRAADGDGLRQYNGTNNGELVQKGEQTRYVSKTEFWDMNGFSRNNSTECTVRKGELETMQTRNLSGLNVLLRHHRRTVVRPKFTTLHYKAIIQYTTEG